MNVASCTACANASRQVLLRSSVLLEEVISLLCINEKRVDRLQRGHDCCFWHAANYSLYIQTATCSTLLKG